MSLSPPQIRCISFLALCASASSASAQGFGVNEVGTCAVGRGFAVTGAVCNDGSVIYWNPAAAAELGKTTATLGASSIDLVGGFRQDTTGLRYGANLRPSIVPDIFLNYNPGPVALGLGVYVPYGLTSQWNGDFPGRFSALKASLKNVYVQPNIAYAITPNWSIGGGPVIGHSSVELVQGIDLSTQPVPGQPLTFGQLGIASETEFATAHLKGSATAWGYNLGIHGKLSPAWSVGARYLSALRFDYNGADATFAQVPTGLILAANNPITGVVTPVDVLLQGQFAPTGALSSQKAKTTIRDPWQMQVGVGFTGIPGTTLSADIARLGWSDFNKLPITFTGNAAASSRTLLEDYNDSWSYRFGAEYTVQNSGMWHGVSLRGGFSYAQTPAPDVTVNPLLPDMPRRNGSIGLGVPLCPVARVDLSYLHVGTPGRRGRIAERVAGQPSATETAAQLNTGSYDLQADVLSLTLTTTF